MPAPKYRPRTETELDALSDARLIEQLVAARAAGDTAQVTLALRVLVFGYWDLVVTRLRAKLPAHVVEDVAADVMVRAIGAAYDGSSVGEFVSWLQTIVARSIVDWFRGRERRPDAGPLPEGEDLHPGLDAEGGAVELWSVVDAALGALSGPHRLVVELAVLDGLDGAEVCRRVPGMTPANVHQVVRRFRVRLRAMLEETR